MEVHLGMMISHKTVFESLRAPHAQEFSMAIPIDGLVQHISPMKYRVILKYRLMIPLFSVDVTCTICLNFVGEHVVHRRDLSGFKY